MPELELVRETWVELVLQIDLEAASSGAIQRCSIWNMT